MSPAHARPDDPLLTHERPGGALVALDCGTRDPASLAWAHSTMVDETDPKLLEAAQALEMTPAETLETMEAFGLTLEDDAGGHAEVETVVTGHPFEHDNDPATCRHHASDVMVETLAAWIEPDGTHPAGRWEFRVKAICRCGTDFDIDPTSGHRPREGGPGVVFEMHPLTQAIT